MFSHKHFRPAFAGVGANPEKLSRKNQYENMMRESVDSDADDFHSFGSPAEDRAKRTAPKKASKPAFDPKKLIIPAIAALALIVVIVLIIVVASASGGDLMKENNSFVSYVSGDGTYQVAMNGKTVGVGFENEVELTVAADNSFAYVVEHSPEGEVVYLLKDKQLEEFLTSPVLEVLELAEFHPGVIYTTEKGVYYTTKDNQNRLTKDTNASNYVISPDGKVVAFVEPDSDDVLQSRLYVMREDGVKDPYAKNMIPEAMSEDGDYIYASAVSASDNATRMLYLINAKDVDDKQKIADDGFFRINYINADGTEILYTTGSIDGGYKSYVFNVKDDEPVYIGNGMCVPLLADSNIARLDTLKGAVVENIIPGVKSATYLLNNKFESELIAAYNGKLNAKGDIFYFINGDGITSGDGALYYIDLGEKNLEKEYIFADVKDFVVTQKDNVYLRDIDDTLMFFTMSTGKKKGICDDVLSLSMYDYSNTVYFEVEDEPKSYFSEEGSTKEAIEFGRTEIASAPIFIDNNQKKTFAYTYNETTGAYNLYYTANGKSFKLVADSCSDINGVDMGIIGDIQDAVEDAIG